MGVTSACFARIRSTILHMKVMIPCALVCCTLRSASPNIEIRRMETAFPIQGAPAQIMIGPVLK